MTPVWERVGSVSIASSVSLADTAFFDEDSVPVAVPLGRYDVEAQFELVEPPSEVARIVVAVRIVPSPSCVVFARGMYLGDVKVTFGQIGICDHDAAEAVFAAWSDEARDRYYEEDLNANVEIGEVALAEGVSIVWFRPGLDVNEVYALVDPSGRLCGVELLSLAWDDSRTGRAERGVDE